MGITTAAYSWPPVADPVGSWFAQVMQIWVSFSPGVRVKFYLKPSLFRLPRQMGQTSIGKDFGLCVRSVSVLCTSLYSFLVFRFK